MNVFFALLCLCNAKASTPYFLEREKTTTEKMSFYKKNIEDFHAAFKKKLTQTSLELSKKIETPSRIEIESGYQIVPKILPDEKTEAETELNAQSYSWPQTDRLIQIETDKLGELKEKLKIIERMNRPDRLKVLDAMISEFKNLRENFPWLDHHIQHNRLWQKAVFDDRERFDRLTRLHDLVFEREALRKKIKADPRGEWIEEERQLTKTLLDAAGLFGNSQGLSVRKPKTTLLEINVRVYTDIQNEFFLKQFKKIVERRWYLEERENTYRVRVEIAPIDCKKINCPKTREKFDIEAHVQKFPKNGVVLTTGAISTYAVPGRFVALGPQALTENTLAHEFGHLLGFIDAYFRGYRNLGPDGFQILEVVPEPGDIMCDPKHGRVQRWHFEKLAH